MIPSAATSADGRACKVLTGACTPEHAEFDGQPGHAEFLAGSTIRSTPEHAEFDGAYDKEHAVFDGTHDEEQARARRV